MGDSTIQVMYLVASTSEQLGWGSSTLPLAQMRVWSVIEQTSWHSGDGWLASGGIGNRVLASGLTLAEAEARAQAEQGAVA